MENKKNMRLKMLYDIYERTKNVEYYSDIKATDEDYRRFIKLRSEQKHRQFSISNKKCEMGEVYLIGNFMFLFMGEAGDRYWGYKVSELIEMTTNKDVVFEFDGYKWVAITVDLFIPKKIIKKSTFLGNISEEYVDVFFNYIKNGKIDPKHTGLTIDLSNSYFLQAKFRQEELKEVAQYLFNI